jgi:hypothetical protein
VTGSRRFSLAEVSEVLLLAVAAAPAAAAGPGNQPDVANIQVLSSRSFTDNGYLNIVGDLKNTTDSWRTALKVIARLYNSSGSILKKASVFSELDLVRPHTRAPFHIVTLKPAHYDHYSLSTTSDTTNARPIGNLVVTKGTPYITPPGDEHFPGHVTNNNGFGVDFTVVIATLFDSNGRVVNVDFNYTNPTHIAAHATNPYVVTFTGHYSAAVTVRIQVEAVHS